jgi:hypothetical protein
LSDTAEVRESIEEHIGASIVEHHINRCRISSVLQDLGHAGAAQFFSSELPRSERTRKGNFGEVVASDYLVQRQGYSMPVLKLRFRDHANLPMRGEDIVAFRLNANRQIDAVIVGEAKCLVRYEGRTIEDAHARLSSAFHPRPLTMSMLSEILYERGDDELASEIDRVSHTLARSSFRREHWLFLINERQPETVFSTLDDFDEVLPDLHCVGVILADLTSFVNGLFDHPVLPLVENAP